MSTLQNEIRRVVVLGHTGFIGHKIMTRLQAEHRDVDVIGLSLSDVDLTNQNSTQSVKQYLSPETAVVMCAAIKRQLGDMPDVYLQNTAMMVNLVNLLAAHPVRRVVYLSSTAVYGEDVESLATVETSPINCRTYYGLAKHTAEWMLRKMAGTHPELSVGVVRVPTVYGPGDPGTAYGPSGFLNAATDGRPVSMSGDGAERREFVYIDDVVEMLTRYVFVDHSDVVNVVSGQSYTFQDILNAITDVTGKTPDVEQSERANGKVDITFDNTVLRTLMPDLSFTTLADGIRKMHGDGQV